MIKILNVILLLSLLSACSFSPYTFTFNDNIVYSPKPVIEHGIMADANLQGCLNQAYLSIGESNPEKVTLLACPGASIESLIGIELLINLEQLDLSNNSIKDISVLFNLEKLRVINLRNNQLGSISALFSLPILRFISLQGNTGISCRQLDRMEEKLGSTLTRPISCQ